MVNFKLRYRIRCRGLFFVLRLQIPMANGELYQSRKNE
ncbi:hypothetical protein ABIC22_004377 [Paenibacillus sp. PvP094]